MVSFLCCQHIYVYTCKHFTHLAKYLSTENGFLHLYLVMQVFIEMTACGCRRPHFFLISLEFALSELENLNGFHLWR